MENMGLGIVKKMESSKNSKIYSKIAFLLTIITLIIIGFLLSFIPNKLDLEYIKENYIVPLSDFTAEKSEFIQYVILTFSFPILFIAFDRIIHRISPSIHKSGIEDKIIDIVFAFGIIGVIVMLFVNKTVYIEYHYILLSIFSILLIFIYEKTKKYFKLKLIIDIILSILIIAIIVLCGYIYINNNFAETHSIRHHFSAYFNPVYKVISGLTPGVDFTSIYGYYSYFYAFVMQLIGRIDILIFSIIVSILLVISIGSLSCFSYKLIRNKIVFALTVFSIIFTQITSKARYGDIYYLQYTPHRILFPAIILAYILLYQKVKKHKKLVKYVGFAISILSIIWNLETGIVVLGTWGLFLLYEVLYNYELNKKIIKPIFKIAVMSVISLIASIAIIYVITIIRVGTIIDIKNFIFGQAIFFGDGFNMIKMELWSPWIIIVIIYAIALAVSLRNVKFMNFENNIENFNRYSILFSAAVLGMGIFSYYQGRSYWGIILAIMYPAIIISGIFVDSFVFNFKKYGLFDKIMYGSICASIVFVLTSCTGMAIYDLNTNSDIKYELDKKTAFNNSNLKEDIDILKRIKEIVGEIDIIHNNESYYYLELETLDKKTFPNFQDLIKKDDLKKALQYINNNKKVFAMSISIYRKFMFYFNEELEKTVENEYEILSRDSMVFFINRDNWDKIELIKNILEEKI